jgi:hypothetical protein
MTGICPACRSSEMPGMQLKPGRADGWPFWSPCRVCRGQERIVFLARPLGPDVMAMIGARS